jgi:hypothetical protein
MCLLTRARVFVCEICGSEACRPVRVRGWTSFAVQVAPVPRLEGAPLRVTFGDFR